MTDSADSSSDVSSPVVRQLFPAYAGEVDTATLRRLYAYPVVDSRAWVRANMVSSLDGGAVRDGKSGGLSGEADKAVFQVLRGLADVVLVGAGTARSEGYKPPRPKPAYADLRAALDQAPAPVLALVSGRLDLDPSSELFGGPPGRRTIVVTHAGTDASARDRLAEVADVVVAGRESVDLADALTQLSSRGLLRVLCEGGPSLLADLAAAGQLEELCLSLAPVLVAGDGPRILTGPDLGVDLTLAHLLESDGTLLSRWVRP